MTWAAVESICDRLGDRDRQIIRELGRLRVATGQQLERLLFADLGGAHADRTRRRVLARLVNLHLLTTLARRVGGVRAGSAGLIFVLDVGGLRVLHALLGRETDSPRPRRPGTPTERFLLHSLAVSELYVQLVERARDGSFGLLDYRAEPAAWWQDEQGGWVKPDALLTLRTASYDDDWTVEVDRATESLPTLRRKLLSYVELAERGETGPGGVLPRVLVTVPTEARRATVAWLIEQLPAPAAELLHVVIFDQAVDYLIAGLI